MGGITLRIYLKASLSAPSSVCNALSICAVAEHHSALRYLRRLKL